MQLIKPRSEELRKAKHRQLPHSVKGSYFRGVTECDSISPQMMSGAELSRGDHIFPPGRTYSAYLAIIGEIDEVFMYNSN